ncbi:hypothetical protein OG689_34325 [Kitasatospora sp. NBC_00240]|uniref:hypothetical protein n=1 Tax=Kitasatospora sp. NBC_00240 TaxID=2903567 RepID=UPI002254C43F|nr:hypothetical protein [Kitasatospora sp. NBC_00240]MCX5214284.1 hypothetical protein [Kitasatospora sp. NBC_00240]
MNRTSKLLLVLAAAAGLAGLPGVAVADVNFDATTAPWAIVLGDGNQLAGDDIFNVGGDNTVGSFNGEGSGVLAG